MKNPHFLLLGGLLLAANPQARAQTSGRLQYEVTQRIEPGQMRIMVNGQEVKPGSPDYPTDVPDSRSSKLTLAFAGSYAKEEVEMPMMRTVINGPNAAPEVSRIARPFSEATYLNLAGRSSSTVFSVKDRQTTATTTYRADAPLPAVPATWQLGTQTRKIAGYTCRKATATHKKLAYTLWVTTELPFTYSPVKDLTPDKGVVLALESEREQYRASKVSLQPVPEAEVRPSGEARQVSAAELKDLREKTLADMRQRMMEDATTGSR
jgi:GLPGLI family protein